jgi:nucleoside-diphosphate-sugar epimerase
MCETSSATLQRSKIAITGGAGLVGQNLIFKLLERGCTDLHVIDKSSRNLAIAAGLHPGQFLIVAASKN